MLLASLCAFGWGAAVHGIPISISTDAVLPDPAPQLGAGWEMWQMFSYLPAMAGDARYQKIASALSGITVRVGGITADWTQYVIQGSSSSPAAVESGSVEALSYWPLYEENLTSASFNVLLDYFAGAGISVIFDLNELYGRNCNTTAPSPPPYDPGEWCVGPWDTSNAEAFLQYIHDAGLVGGPNASLVAFELGNELVTHLDARANVADIRALAGIIQRIWSDVPAGARPPLYAPSTDSCTTPAQLEIMANISGVAGVGGFSYHSYPGGGATGGLAPLVLNSTWLRTAIGPGFEEDVACLAAWNGGPRAAGLKLLVTESSSSWSTSVPAPAQNSFINGFFSIAEWGQYASVGVAFVARWAWSEGSPFALIAQNGTRWDVAADFWLMLTFRKLVSEGVLASSGSEDSDALVYAYCSSSGGGGGASNGSVVITAVNPSAAPIALSFVDGSSGGAIAATPRLEYVFTAPGGNLSSTTPLLNGGPALRINEDGSLPPVEPAYVPAGGAGALLPPYSQAFFVLLDADVKACGGAASMGP